MFEDAPTLEDVANAVAARAVPAAAAAAAGDDDLSCGKSEAAPVVRSWCEAQPLTLVQIAVRRLADAVMRHEGELEVPRSQRVELPRTWFRRELRVWGREALLAHEMGAEAVATAKRDEREAAETAARRAETAKRAVAAIITGNCSEQHAHDWALLWYAESGVGDSRRLNCGLEGSAAWWGGPDDTSADRRGSLAADLKLLVAGHLRGRHLAQFVVSQPGGLLGLMQTDAPSDDFFQLLRAVLAQANLYVGAVGFLEGVGCGCGCGSYGVHEQSCRLLQKELSRFAEAVSGSNGIIQHPLHWRGLTRKFNNQLPAPSPALRYYRLAESKGLFPEVTFHLPYPLHPLLVYPHASSGGSQHSFFPPAGHNSSPQRNDVAGLRDRSGFARSDGNTSFVALCGEEQLFTALSVLAKSADLGRHHVVVFQAFWMLLHLGGVLRQPTESPNFYSAAFEVDVLLRLAVSMSAFRFFFKLPLSCLAFAARRPQVNPWQLASARQAVLVLYGLNQEAGAHFAKNVGRIPTCSHYYDDLLLWHLYSELHLALDVLLEMYVTLAMHKRCPREGECWDCGGRDKLRQTLDRLKRTLHGRLAEPEVSARLQANLRGALSLIPLLEFSANRLELPPSPGPTRKDQKMERAFVAAHCALGTLDPAEPEILGDGDESRLVAPQLRLSFARVVPISGERVSERNEYANFVYREMRFGPVEFESQTTWWASGLVSTDRLYAELVFFALWQGPTQFEPFWPTWPLPNDDQVPFPALEEGGEEWVNRHAAVALQVLAQEVETRYRVCSSERHHRLPLLRQLLRYLSADEFVPSFGVVNHRSQTAARSVYLEANRFCYKSEDCKILEEPENSLPAERALSLLRYAHREDYDLTTDVLDFGRDAVRLNGRF